MAEIDLRVIVKQSKLAELFLGFVATHNVHVRRRDQLASAECAIERNEIKNVLISLEPIPSACVEGTCIVRPKDVLILREVVDDVHHRLHALRVEFQLLLDEYPIKDLHIIIPHFHNTVNRYNTFNYAIMDNVVDRLSSAEEEVCEFLMLESLATKMYKMQKRGELQLRVTHNDTKCNNVLFDKDTLNHLCVIDLDTVMPGLIGFDFGDAIRFAANTCSEDETDISKVGIDLNKFEAFTKGFLSKVADYI